MTPSQLVDSAKAPWTRTMVGCMGWSFRVWGCSRQRGPAEPVLEVGGGDGGVEAVELGAEVARGRVRRHLAPVAGRLKDAADELVETECFGARELDRVVQR